MYLVHSYYVPLLPETIAQSDYDGAYSVALQKDNFYGVQFHPEKEQYSGKSTPTKLFSLMRIIPAIDVIDGKCVRLSKGDYSTQKTYNEHPLEVAKAYEAHGIRAPAPGGSRRSQIKAYRQP